MAGSKIPACAAVPLLGAALVGDEELDALFEHVVGTMRSKKSKNEGDRLKTNADGLDDALGGGLERGRVVCVSCESGSGGMEVRGALFFEVVPHHLLSLSKSRVPSRLINILGMIFVLGQGYTARAGD